MSMLSWLFAGSQLFFSCTGNTAVDQYVYKDGPTQTNDPERLTASLMVKPDQAIDFKPNGDRVAWHFEREGHEKTDGLGRSCYDSGYNVHECVNITSDPTMFYFALESRNYGITDRINAKLDRVTGQLWFDWWTNNRTDDGKNSWGHVTYTMVCKKVDKLLDAK